MNNLGKQAEALAAIFLQQQGLKLVATNYSCKYGEIDLIMREQKTLVFVEVRLRKSAQFGGAAASINYSKQQKVRNTAEHYLQQHGDAPCRFDAILMQNAALEKIEWVKNAF